MQPATQSVAASHAAQAVDAVARGPVLVVGSPPPGGRDLDLLATPDDHRAISALLAKAGFVRWRHIWARVDSPPVYAVDLSSTERWGTSPDAATVLFEDAEPIPGFIHLVTPGPATILLIAARGTVTRRGRLTPKVTRRVSEALNRDPDAWARAEERAANLGMVGAIRLLRRTYDLGRPLPPVARAVSLAGVVRHEGPLRPKLRILRGARPGSPRPTTISFSGLDGSGKSTQVRELQESLKQLGVASSVQWAGFKTARRLRAALPVLDRRLGRGEPAPAPRDPLIPTALRDSAAGRQAWVFVVVCVNALHLWGQVLRPRRGTRVLVLDRFSPDSMVKLGLHYDRRRRIDVRWQRRLFALLSPKPDVGFFVDVSSDVAFGRRQEQTLEELTIMRELYVEHYGRFGLQHLDGTQQPDVLRDRVVASAWRGLR